MKSDKKFNGIKISALSHVEYINREKNIIPSEPVLSEDDYKKLVKHDSENFEYTKNFVTDEKIPLNVRENFLQSQLRKQKENLKKLKAFAKNKQTKKRGKEKSSSHVDYIQRKGNFERREDCIYTDSQIPSWANGDAKNFFAAADKFEGYNRRKYIELEFSLPNELTSVEQYKQIIDELIKKHLQNHYYAYAIHEKIGVLSENERHPHVHLMLSERLIDDVERQKERTPENYFKYPFRQIKNGSEPTFEEKWKRGAKRDRRWNKRDFLLELRADFARIQNEVLKKNGFSIRVDHRSLKEQKADAERNGDILLAQILDREPEKNIGIVTAHKDKVKIAELKKERQQRTEKINKLFESHAEQQKAINANTKERNRKLIVGALELLDKPEVKEEKNPDVQKLAEELQSSIRELNIWRNMLANDEEVKRSVEMEYLTESEEKIWQKNFELSNRKANMEKFLQNLQSIKINPQNPPQVQAEQNRTKQQWTTALEQNLLEIENELKKIQPDVNKIAAKINTPNTRKNINFATKDALKANNVCRSKVYELCDEVNQKRMLLRQVVFEREFNLAVKQIYSADTINNVLKNRQKGIIIEGRKLDKMLNQTRKKVINYNRALEMAENVFVKGEWKNWREKYRKFRKNFADLNLPNKKEDFTTKIDELSSRLTREPEKAAYFADAIKGLEKFNADKKRLEEICNRPENKTKIVEIAYGIVKKNSGVLKKYNDLKAVKAKLISEYREIDEKKSIVKARMAFDNKIERKKPKLLIGYSVKKPNIARNADSYPSESTVANLIAQAFAQSAKRNDADGIVQLRANLDGEEMPMSWSTMSEFAKDEQKLKALSRSI